MIYLLLSSQYSSFIDIADSISHAQIKAEQFLTDYVGEKPNVLLYEIDAHSLRKKFVGVVSFH